MNVPNFDITMTATLRPELLRITLDSFYKNLFHEAIRKARLIINIDYVGGINALDNRIRLKQVEELIDLYQWRDVEKRIGWKPFFPTAFLWGMDNIDTPIFFHLEEDWELREMLSFEDMFTLFDKYENLVHLRLSMFGKAGEDNLKNWTKMLPWNGDFFQIQEEDIFTIGWAGHPALNRTDFMHECLCHIDPRKNPEKQIKGFRYPYPLNEILKKYIYGSYHPKHLKKPAIFDIGRQWMAENKFEKKGIKAFFVEWQKVGEE